MAPKSCNGGDPIYREVSMSAIITLNSQEEAEAFKASMRPAAEADSGTLWSNVVFQSAASVRYFLNAPPRTGAGEAMVTCDASGLFHVFWLV
jgi:hypothetical protein